MCKLWVLLNLISLLLASCTLTLVTPQSSNVPITDLDCPASKLQHDIVSETMQWSLIGDFPIWLLVHANPKVKQTNAILELSHDSASPNPLGNVLGQYTVLLTDESLTGSLTLQGKQLGSDNSVYFGRDSQELQSETKLENYVDVLTLPSIATTDADIPKGFNSHFLHIIYPQAGCYQFTAELKNDSNTYHTEFVIQIMEEQ